MSLALILTEIKLLPAIDSQQLSPEGVRNILHLYEDVQRNRDLDASGPLPPLIAIFQSVWSKMREKKRLGESSDCVSYRLASDPGIQVLRVFSPTRQSITSGGYLK
jgi:hypothetical protein